MFHSEDHLHSVIEQPHIDNMSQKMIERLTERLQGNSDPFYISTINCEWGEGLDYYRFLPQLKAAAKIGGGSLRSSTHCFTEVSVEVSASTPDSITLEVRT